MKADNIFFYLICVALAIITSGCAHLDVTDPVGPGGVIVAEDSTGFFFNQNGYNLFLNEGVPAAYFTPVPNGTYHITDAMLHAANLIRDNRANPPAPNK